LAHTASRDAADAIVEVRALHRHYGAVRAVDGVDLEIARGEMFGLIGHNGAGKTTLFRMLLGLVAPSAGEIAIDGVSVTGDGFRALRRRLGYLPENVVFYDNLTGLETLRFFARLKRAETRTCLPLLERVGLAHAAGRRIREYSKGMRQRLGLAQALLGEPRLLFLDEPTSGLDPAGIRDFYAMLRELQATGVTIVLTSHVLAEIQQRVDRLAIMAAGRVRAVGTVASLRAARQLPAVITVEAAAGARERLRAALAGLPVTVHEGGATALAIECRPDLRLHVLGVLAGMADAVGDFTLQEATLEDVLFAADGGPL